MRQTNSKLPIAPPDPLPTTTRETPRNNSPNNNGPADSPLEISSTQKMAPSGHDPELGDFERLPKELRLELYSYLLTDNFSQVLAVDPFTGIPNSFNSRSLPALFTVSNRIQLEMIQSVMVGRTCMIQVGKNHITTNFPVCISKATDNRINYAKDLRQDSIRIPLCRKLTLSIQIPSRRRPDDFLRLRRNVETVVNALNASNEDELPRIEVRLIEGGPSRVWNDLAMLVGPIARFERLRSNAFLLREDGGRILDPQSEQQWQLFENFLSGSTDATKELRHQQTMLDIKLALWDHERSLFKLEMRERVQSVRKWCKDYEEEEPAWLDDVELFSLSPRLLTPDVSDLIRTVLNGRSESRLGYWMAGLKKSFIP